MKKYDKNSIDKQAEREGTALRKQGRHNGSGQHKIIRLSKDDDSAKIAWERMFKD